MPKGGKKRGKATNVLKLERGKVYGRDDEPKPIPIEPKGTYDKLNGAEQKIWDELYSILAPLELVTEADGENFANVCRIVARLREIDKIMADPETKMLVSYMEMAPNGTEKIVVKLNPIYPEQRQLMKDLRLYAPEFGMTPRGRVGLSVGGSSEKKPKIEGMID